MAIELTHDEYIEKIWEKFPNVISTFGEEEAYNYLRNEPEFQAFDIPTYGKPIEPVEIVKPAPSPYDEPDQGYLGLGGDWLPDIVKAGYNESITGIAQELLTDKLPFDKSKLFIDEETGQPGDPELIEQVGITLASMLLTPDIIAMTVGGKPIEMSVRGALKLSTTNEVKKKLMKAGIKNADDAGRIATSSVDQVLANGLDFNDMLYKSHKISEVMSPKSQKWLSKSLKINQSASGFAAYEGMSSAVMQLKETGKIDPSKVALAMGEGYALGAGVSFVHQGGAAFRRGKSGAIQAASYVPEIAIEAGVLNVPHMIKGEMPTNEQWAHSMGTVFGIKGISIAMQNWSKNKAKRKADEVLENNELDQQISAREKILPAVEEGTASHQALSKEIIELKQQRANKIINDHLKGKSKEILNDLKDGTVEENFNKGKYTPVDFQRFLDEKNSYEKALNEKLSSGEKLTAQERIDLDNISKIDPALVKQLGKESLAAIGHTL